MLNSKTGKVAPVGEEPWDFSEARCQLSTEATLAHLSQTQAPQPCLFTASL